MFINLELTDSWPAMHIGKIKTAWRARQNIESPAKGMWGTHGNPCLWALSNFPSVDPFDGLYIIDVFRKYSLWLSMVVGYTICLFIKHMQHASIFFPYMYKLWISSTNHYALVLTASPAIWSTAVHIGAAVLVRPWQHHQPLQQWRLAPWYEHAAQWCFVVVSDAW